MGMFSNLFSSLKSPKGIATSLLTGGVSTGYLATKDSHDGINEKLFPKGKSPPDAPPAPTIDSAEASAQDKEEQLRRRRGMAATILGGMDATQPTTQAASLLGN